MMRGSRGRVRARQLPRRGRSLVCLLLVACSAPRQDPPPSAPPPAGSPDAVRGDASVATRPVIRPHRHIALVVIPLVAVPLADGSADAASRDVAVQVSRHLLRTVRADRDAEVTGRHEMRDFALEHDCTRPFVACLAEIGASLSADYVLLGEVAPSVDGFAVELQLVDVAHRTARSWTATTPREATSLAALAAGGYDYFVARM